jgi:site-specific DNA recombinase
VRGLPWRERYGFTSGTKPGKRQMVVERRQPGGNLESDYQRCAATQAISQPDAPHGRNTTHQPAGIGGGRIRVEHRSSAVFKRQLTTAADLLLPGKRHFRRYASLASDTPAAVAGPPPYTSPSKIGSTVKYLLMKAVGYARIPQASERGVSLEARAAKIRAMAEVQGAELADLIVEGGESAKSLDRPGMQRRLELIDAWLADRVIVAKLDRITRGVEDLAELLELFASRDVALVSVNESLDTATASGRLVMNPLCSHWERETIGERTRQALQYKKSVGRWIGGIPYGHKLAADSKHLEPAAAESGPYSHSSVTVPRLHVSVRSRQHEPQRLYDSQETRLASRLRWRDVKGGCTTGISNRAPDVACEAGTCFGQAAGDPEAGKGILHVWVMGVPHQ